MTHILLISDNERVKRVFESLGKSDSLQLRTATTLIQADQEISNSAPEFSFVQSRISGFSGEIIFRHLNKILPAAAKTILLTGDADEMKQARKHAEIYLDLTLDDEALVGVVRDILSGVWRPQAVAADRATPAQSNQRPPAADSVPASVSATAEKVPKAKTIEDEPEQEQPKTSDQAARSAYLSQQDGGNAGAESFAEVMRRASNQGATSEPVPFEADERGPHGKSGVSGQHGPGPDVPATQERSSEALLAGEPLADAMRRAKKKERPLWIFVVGLVLILIPIVSYFAGKQAAPPELALAPRSISPLRHPAKQAKGLAKNTATSVVTVPAAGPVAAPAAKPTVPAAKPVITAVVTAAKPIVTAAKPVITAPKPVVTAAKPIVTAVKPVVTAAKPVVTAPKPVVTTAKPMVTAAKPVVTVVKPVPVVTATKPVVPAAKPVVTVAQPETPTAKPAVPPEAKPAAPPVKGGLKSLPPIVSHAKLDSAYGKTHPGWQRYLGADIEYKLFKEAELYRALQVFGRNGESIADPLFKRVLKEFSGNDRFQLKSAGEKGKYLVEQGETRNGVAVTLYRNKTENRLKAFVLYYH